MFYTVIKRIIKKDPHSISSFKNTYSNTNNIFLYFVNQNKKTIKIILRKFNFSKNFICVNRIK